jgi:hypothetical protein
MYPFPLDVVETKRFSSEIHTCFMQRLYLYDGSMAIVGVVLGFDAALDLAAGQSSIPLWLMAVGGGGMVVSALYEAITTDPDDFSIKLTRSSQSYLAHF